MIYRYTITRWHYDEVEQCLVAQDKSTIVEQFDTEHLLYAQGAMLDRITEIYQNSDNIVTIHLEQPTEWRTIG